VTSLDEFLDGEDLDGHLVSTERKLERQKTELSVAAAKVKAITAELEAADARLDMYEAAAAGKVPPKWLTPARAKKKHATVCVMLSDCHWDEVINPAEVGGVNDYNRTIAEQRLNRFVSKTIELSTSYIRGVEVDGLCLLLGGDMVSGDIHEELKESNEGSSLETVVHWSAQLAGAIATLHDHFGKVHVASVVGNHGRRTRKPRSKGRVHDNFDWLLVHSASTLLGDRKGLTWQVPESADTIVTVYDTRHLLTHGDKVTGGGGIGGIWPPIKRMQARMQSNPVTEHDILVMGHWHQLVLATTAGLIVNGSTKGYDEYAATNAFAYEDPRQAWWLVTPEHGVTMSAPILVMDRKAEGW